MYVPIMAADTPVSYDLTSCYNLGHRPCYNYDQGQKYYHAVQDAILLGEEVTVNIPPGVVLVFSRHIIQELGTGWEAILVRGDQ